MSIINLLIEQSEKEQKDFFFNVFFSIGCQLKKKKK